jgi:beta-glucosidase/6-phospho-beta-glucosidase/beta-galactosidase
LKIDWMNITESGIALPDYPDEQGYMNDAGRVNYLRGDFLTGKRIPKRSARWYSEVIAANGVPAFALGPGGRSAGGG